MGVRQDLIVVLKKLAKRVRSGKLKLDAIVIETTGMADPAPVAQTFFVDDEVKAFARLDGIVTMVDAKHIEQHLDEEKPEGAENEADEKELERITKRLRDINKFAPVQRCTNSQVSVDSVLDIKGFDLARTLEMDPEFLNTDGEHMHDQSVTSLGINQMGSLDLDMIQAWVGDLLQNKGADIFRMKGVLSIAGHDSKFVYQAVHMIFNGDFSDPWGDEPRINKLTFIGKNLNHEELKQGFMACIDSQQAREKRF